MANGRAAFARASALSNPRLVQQNGFKRDAAR
jgi:hypothetical protein